MSFGTILDVIIGVTFTYLLLSLVCTAVNEMIAGAVNLRGKTLWKGVKTLVGDGAFENLVGEIYDHPLIAGMVKAERQRQPSYMTSGDFALALLEKVGVFRWADRAKAATENGPSASDSEPLDAVGTLARARTVVERLPAGSGIRRVMQGLLDESVKDIGELRARVERWFDDGMGRVSGGYKRTVQIITLLVAAALSIGLCVDTLSIAEALFHDGQLRSHVAAAASTWHERVPQPGGKEALGALQALDLPIGWGYSVSHAPRPNDQNHDYLWYWIKRALGVLFTTLAVSLGAPFWFDTLGRVVNLRSAGPKPPRAAAATPP